MTDITSDDVEHDISVPMTRHNESVRVSFENGEAVVSYSQQELRLLVELSKYPQVTVLGPHLMFKALTSENIRTLLLLASSLFFFLLLAARV